MPESQARLNITTKDVVYAITLIAMIVTFFVRFALVETRVEQNTLVLDTYSLPVIDYKMGEMDKKLDRVLVLLGE